ncbi:MAG: carboxy-S-adenosyl-L-methionine synthase CmoA [Gammaproteobacteria bacterium]|nr:MAG: carboxy-S-adenosyl-L-methionine synthase CmoA [Gammaproteobacteria bacterium]
MSSSDKDRIYASKQDKVEDFAFDEYVAGVFADMIQRSVPGYTALNQLLPLVANQFIQPNSNVYDLGCSLGEASISIAKSMTKTMARENVNIFAVDNSIAMIRQLQERLASIHLEALICPLQDDVTEVEINNGSFAILNYTLQFVERSKRDALIKSICKGLNAGGALLLSEKITHQDENEDALMQRLHENFKRQNDYSEMEISQKREALENVLKRDTHEQHIERLHQAGFSKVSILTKYLNFVSYLAIKD